MFSIPFRFRKQPRVVFKMRQRPLCLCVLAVLVAALLGQARAISFILEPDVKQCVREEVHKDVLVVGEYKVSEVQGQSTEIRVRTSGLSDVASC